MEARQKGCVGAVAGRRVSRGWWMCRACWRWRIGAEVGRAYQGRGSTPLNSEIKVEED